MAGEHRDARDAETRVDGRGIGLFVVQDQPRIAASRHEIGDPVRAQGHGLAVRRLRRRQIVQQQRRLAQRSEQPVGVVGAGVRVATFETVVAHAPGQGAGFVEMAHQQRHGSSVDAAPVAAGAHVGIEVPLEGTLQMAAARGGLRRARPQILVRPRQHPDRLFVGVPLIHECPQLVVGLPAGPAARERQRQQLAQTHVAGKLT